jgi:hypothetical protein
VVSVSAGPSSSSSIISGNTIGVNGSFGTLATGGSSWTEYHPSFAEAFKSEPLEFFKEVGGVFCWLMRSHPACLLSIAGELRLIRTFLGEHLSDASSYSSDVALSLNLKELYGDLQLVSPEEAPRILLAKENYPATKVLAAMYRMGIENGE